MLPVLLIIILLLLMGTAIGTLLLDAREQSIERQLAIVLQTSHAASLPSLRRSQAGSRWRFLHRLVNYKAEIPYVLNPAYVLLGGVVAAAAIFFANNQLEFSSFYASFAAAIGAIMVVRGLF